MMLHGNCLNIMPTLADKSIDAVICDIPSGRTACEWDVVIPFEAMWTQLKRLISPRGAIVLLGCTQPFTSDLLHSNRRWFREELIWEKNGATGHLNAKKRHLRAHENVLIFCRTSTLYNPQKSTGHPPTRTGSHRGGRSHELYGNDKSRDEGYKGITDRYPRSVLRVNKTHESEGVKHPTQKPVALLEYLIRTYTNEGDTILDFAAGSGTTHVAALNTGRQCISIEKDDHYYSVLCERVAAVEAQARCV